MKLKFFLVNILFMLSLVSCTSKWPANYEQTLESSEDVRIAKNLLHEFGVTTNGYTRTLLSNLKIQYPDFNAYKSDLNNRTELLQRIFKNTLIQYIAQGDFELVVNIMIKNSPEISQLEDTDYFKYKQLRNRLKQSIINEFSSMRNFAREWVYNPHELIRKLEGIAEHSVRAINQY